MADPVRAGARPRRRVTGARDTPDAARELVLAVQEVGAVLREGHERLVEAEADLSRRYRDAARVLALVASVGGARQDAASPELIDDTDRAILDALDRGIPRRTLHREVGLTKRRLDERIARLRDLTQTETPFQFARAVDALGWLPPRHPLLAPADVVAGNVSRFANSTGTT